MEALRGVGGRSQIIGDSVILDPETEDFLVLEMCSYFDRRNEKRSSFYDNIVDVKFMHAD